MDSFLEALLHFSALSGKPEFEINNLARIISQHKTRYTALSQSGEIELVLPRGFIHKATSQAELPTVGDWVELERLTEKNKAVIKSVLPRYSMLLRSKAKGRETQSLAANIDTGFIVQGLDGDFNIPRLQRYLALLELSHVKPVLILNKADATSDLEKFVEEAQAAATDLDVISMSAKNENITKLLTPYLNPGETIVFLGSSGVGKSTIINKLLGFESQEVGVVRQNFTGKHTTTTRQLLINEEGVMLVDTPGIRELQVANEDGQAEDFFEDINLLAQQCKYRNCEHQKSEGCAVTEALKVGELTEKRYKQFLKLEAALDLNGSKGDRRQQLKSKHHIQRVQRMTRKPKKR